MADNESRKYIIMINKYKGQITDLEIQNATQQVVMEDQRTRIGELEAELAKLKASATDEPGAGPMPEQEKN